MKRFIFITIVGLSIIFLSGCSSESDNGGGTTYAASGLIVDPYIVGAVMCEDKNINGNCDAQEQLSTASDANGVYKFESALTAGSHIIIKTQGKHEGVTYDLNISNIVVDSTDAGVTSPLSTLNARGLSATQIAAILNTAATSASISGSFSITSSNILSDPISGGLMDKTVTQISDSDLVQLQASLATYALLKIMNGSAALRDLNATELYASGMGTDTNSAVKLIATEVLKGINSSLNTTTLSSIKDAIATARTAVSTGIVTGSGGFVDQATAEAKAKSGIPEPTVSVITKVSVAIIDKLASVGYEKCNATGGNYNLAIADVQTYFTTNITTTNIMKLASQVYGLTYHDAMKSNFTGVYAAALNGIFSADSNIETGYNAGESAYTTFRFNDQNTTSPQ